ncbi:hypothetical protein [Bacteroides nordii]|uniref:hypothetical protein n=1 Tax=Bacteroides nordii TaxID=291645 RepID=UPI003999B0C1
MPDVSLSTGSVLGNIATLARYCALSISERNAPFPGAESCFTCTSKTTLHTEAPYITLREGALSIPEKEIDGNDRRYSDRN